MLKALRLVANPYHYTILWYLLATETITPAWWMENIALNKIFHGTYDFTMD